MIYYRLEITAVNQKMVIESEFLAMPSGDKINIPLKIVYPDGWN